MKDVINEVAELIHGEGEDGFFANVMELEQDYGTAAILCVLQEIAQQDSENLEYRAEYREEAAFLALEITLLLSKLARRLEPSLIVNGAGTGRIH
jgi:hypothetical protein